MKKEIWKAVKGYEGWYEVSNLGRVRSVERIVYYSNNKIYLCKSRIRKPNKVRGGYLTCDLWKNSKHKTFAVHRLVAQAFLPNPDNLPQVNHRDEDKTNNHVSNLEWCDGKYNVNYGTAIQRSAEKRLNSPKLSKPVLQLDLETNQIIAEYPSARGAERQLKISNSSISKCCMGKYKTAYGYKWRYKKE